MITNDIEIRVRVISEDGGKTATATVHGIDHQTGNIDVMDLDSSQVEWRLMPLMIPVLDLMVELSE